MNPIKLIKNAKKAKEQKEKSLERYKTTTKIMNCIKSLNDKGTTQELDIAIGYQLAIANEALRNKKIKQVDFDKIKTLSELVYENRRKQLLVG